LGESEPPNGRMGYHVKILRKRKYTARLLP
jgi:hypothetical protein